MRAVADGYTIMMGQVGTHAFSVALYPNLAYRPDVDFAPIGLVLNSPLLIVARKDFPPKDLRDFAAYIRANGDKLNVAHAGVGSITYTFALYLNSVLGVKPTMVPFQWRCARGERAYRRPRRLHVQLDRGNRPAGAGRDSQGLWD